MLALNQDGTPARGVEPRGAVALRALERGSAVTISEVSEYLATCAEGSLGGLVLSGVVDRLPLHRIIPLLAQSRQALAPAAPVVVVSEAPTGLGPEHGQQHEHEHENQPEDEHRRSELTTPGICSMRASAPQPDVGPAPRALRVRRHRGARRPGRPRRPALRRHGHDAAPVSGVHHFVPVLHRGDAVGRHTLRLRDATRARGLTSNIFVDVVQDDTAEDTLQVLAYREMAEPGDVVVYQFATASLMAPWLAGRRETLVVNYHNVTPPELMEPWDHHLALGQTRAQSDLEVLAPRTTLAVADSGYNEIHLAEAGFGATAVIAPSAALSAQAGFGAPGAAHTTPPRAGQGESQKHRRPTTWLSVGRVSPNKSLEHVITALAVTRHRRDPDATLRIIGKPATEAYDRALRRYVAELGLVEAVTFVGHASDANVAEAYATSDVLVVASEHEGFCVPVVEAMAAGLPVVAFDQGAVPEVLGDAGVLLTTRDPYEVADAVADLLDDGARRADLAGRGRQRVRELELDSTAERFVDLLVPLLGPRPAQQDRQRRQRRRRRR